jgi:hypothetical protein
MVASSFHVISPGSGNADTGWKLMLCPRHFGCRRSTVIALHHVGDSGEAAVAVAAPWLWLVDGALLQSRHLGSRFQTNAPQKPISSAATRRHRT